MIRLIPFEYGLFSMLLAFSFTSAAGELETLRGEIVFADRGNGSQRSYQRTTSADFAKSNFVAEVVVTLQSGQGGNGCAFLGLGKGQADPAHYNEPSTTPALYLRIAPSDFAGGQVLANVDGREAGLGTAPAGDGRHRVKMIWDAAGRRALFDVDGKSTVTVDARGVNFGGNGHIFIGGAGGVKFSDFTVKPLSDAEIKAAGFGETFANDPTAGTWLNQHHETARFIRSLQAGKKVTLVTMGTSLTGGTWRWPDVMMSDWLNKDYPGQVTFFNEGVGASASSVGPNGNSKLSGLGKLPAVIAHKPDVVFIEFAVNDAYRPYKISLDESKRNLNTIIDAILAANPHAEIILQTMNCCTGEQARLRPQLAAYMQGYRDVARKRGLTLVDNFPNWLRLLKDDPTTFARLLPDGVHPRAPGYRLILLPQLKKTLMPNEPTDKTAWVADEFLKSLNARMRLLACWYDGSKLAASRTFSNDTVQTDASRWTCDTSEQRVNGEPDARDLSVTFKLASGAAKSAGVAVAFDFTDWSTNNYVLIPASVYNGNRHRIEHRGYCTGFDAADFYNKNMTQATVPLPQLSPVAGRPSKIEVSACNATTPAICVFDRQAGRGFMVLAEQAGRNARGDFLRKANGEIRDNGFSVEESADRTRATLVVSSPGVRERKPEFIGFSASPDRGMNLAAGDEIRLHLRIFSFATPDIPGLLEKFMTVRKDVTGPNHPRDLYPFSEVEKLMTRRLDSRWHDGGAGHQYYCPEGSDNLCLGWVGGLMNTFPMLALGDELHRRRVGETFDFVIPAAIGRSGYFLATVHANGKASGRDWFPNRPIVLTRQDADVLYWMMKQFLLLKAQGHAAAIKPAWERAAKGLAQAFVNTWKRHGQWGNYVNHKTGDIAIYNSTSGAMAIGGLALAARYFEEPEFMNVAQKAADYYYRRDFVQKGFTFGACSDIMQNADSETAAAFMTSLMALYETTGDNQWLEKSRNLANLVATWTVSYDYQLPQFTELGRRGAKLAGAVWASTQNKHGAPGICCSSGDPLFKIYRATGDRRSADLMRDIAHAWQEGVRNGDLGERLTYCDADSRGVWGGGNGWCELNGALMALELPGIYLQTDSDRFYVLDAVHARIVSRDRSGTKLEISNPTQFAARVAIFAESAAAAKSPLGYTAFLRWPRVSIPPAGRVRVMIQPGGALGAAEPVPPGSN